MTDGLNTTDEISAYLKLSYDWTRKRIKAWGFEPVKTVGTTKFYSDEQKARMFILSKKDEQ